jgi:PAS domain S-box-containing protein
MNDKRKTKVQLLSELEALRQRIAEVEAREAAKQEIGQTEQESEERWQLAMRGTNEGLWDWNVKTNEVFFSPRWKEMLGFADHEIGKSLNEWTSRVHPDDLPWVTQAIQDHFAGKTDFYSTEHRMRCKDDGYKWILDRGKAMWDSEGNVVRAVGSHADITEHKRTEAWLRSLVETTQDAVISIDQAGLMDQFNPAAERIFGYTRAEVYGQKVNLLMPEPYRSEHDNYITDYEHTRQARAIGRIRTVTAQRKNGEIFPIELSVTELKMDQKVRYGAFIRDISEKVRLQEQLVERERLAAVGTIAAKLAHEIGNPLNGMSMNVQLLERRLTRNDNDGDERSLGYIRNIQGEIDRLTLLLQDFRAMSRRQLPRSCVSPPRGGPHDRRKANLRQPPHRGGNNTSTQPAIDTRRRGQVETSATQSVQECRRSDARRWDPNPECGQLGGESPYQHH